MPTTDQNLTVGHEPGAHTSDNGDPASCAWCPQPAQVCTAQVWSILGNGESRVCGLPMGKRGAFPGYVRCRNGHLAPAVEEVAR